MLKFFLTISVALIEDIITVCESCLMLGLESEVFTALYFEKVEGHHYLFEGFLYFLNIVITKKKIHLLGFMFR